MATVNGCDLPEDVFYNLEKHTWARLLDDGTVRLGMTSVAGKLAGGNLAAVTVSARKVGKEILQARASPLWRAASTWARCPARCPAPCCVATIGSADEPSLAVSDPTAKDGSLR